MHDNIYTCMQIVIIIVCIIAYVEQLFCYFFFSSRRRHTRYWRDWSSDVCSSDLGWTTRSSQLYESRLLRIGSPLFHFGILLVLLGHVGRSEERRVGKECRSRWSPYH